MKPSVQDFLSSPSDLARRRGPGDQIVLSSRVRLARNLNGLPFPGTARKNQREEIRLDCVLEVVTQPELNLTSVPGARNHTEGTRAE